MATLTHYFPFDSVNGDRKTTASAERRWWGALFTDGVVGANAFELSSLSASSFTYSKGVCIVGGAVGVSNGGTVSLSGSGLAVGVPVYIVARVNTNTNTRNIQTLAVKNIETATAEQLENGAVHDLPLYKITMTSGANGSTSYTATDMRKFANSFDKAIYSEEFAQVIAETKGDAQGKFDALAASMRAALAEVNAESAGLYGSVGRQGFMNPTFDVNQRGAAEYVNEGGSAYTVDRWRSDVVGDVAGGVVVSTVQDGARHALKVETKPFASGNATAYSAISQVIERGVSTFCAGGESFTVSFDARADVPALLYVEPMQFAQEGGNGAAITAKVCPLTDVWERYSVTFEGTMTPETGADLLRVAFVYAFKNMPAFGGTQNDTNAFYLANMQINKGAAALPCYVRAYGEELEACQRYFAAFDGLSLSVGATLATSNQAITSPLPLSRRMRKRPTVETIDRAGVAGVATAEAAAGGWRNGLPFVVSTESELPVLVIKNTDGSELTRAVFRRVTADAEYMD